MFDQRDDELWIKSIDENCDDKPSSFDDETIEDDNYAIDCVERASDMQLTRKFGY